MMVCAVSGRGTLQLIEGPKQVKVNPQYYLWNSPCHISEVKLSILCPGELSEVTIPHDQASSDTARLT
jgi:hypothetical protein